MFSFLLNERVNEFQQNSKMFATGQIFRDVRMIPCFPFFLFLWPAHLLDIFTINFSIDAPQALFV